MSQDIKKHYKELYKIHGPGPQAVQWSNQETQYKRFEILADIIEPNASVLDIGSGLGELLTYLRTSRGFKGEYFGFDFVEEFIGASKDKFAKDPKAHFETFDVEKDEIKGSYDYIVLSGVLNNRRADNLALTHGMIKKMFHAAKKAVAVNALTTYVDFQQDHLYHHDPLQLFDHCQKNVTKKIVLRHDYQLKENIIPFEFTLYLYR